MRKREVEMKQKQWSHFGFPARKFDARADSLTELENCPPPPRPSPLHTLAANESEDEDTKRGLKAEQHRQSRLQSTLWRVSLLFDFSVESSRSIPRGLKKLCGVRVGWGGVFASCGTIDSVAQSYN